MSVRWARAQRPLFLGGVPINIMLLELCCLRGTDIHGACPGRNCIGLVQELLAARTCAQAWLAPRLHPLRSPIAVISRRRSGRDKAPEVADRWAVPVRAGI